ncbi:MAG: tRNA lysidine(34) synthetase TilS [Clostridia bacterium]|nr:tRNA lysidine(34) synthetase TilS [Clostridia bacterium]
MIDPKEKRGGAYAAAEAAFRRCIEENGMESLLARGVLLAFSGGADSVLLFHLLHAYTQARGIPFAAAHIHHGIRGEEAERDADFCHTMAEEAGVPFFLARVDAPAYAKGEGHGKGLENAARELRYAALTRLMAENPAYGVCATAHNATDNMETVLLHILRGSGLRGICGIPPVRGVFLRPLLYLAKRDVLLALDERGIAYVTDSTNHSNDYDRNYLRAEVLPRFLPLRNDPEAAFTRLSANMREEAVPADRMTEEFLAHHVQGSVASRKELLALPEAVACRVLTRMCDLHTGGEAPERLHIHRLLDLLASKRAHGRYSMPGGFFAVFDRDEIYFETKREDATDYEVTLAMGRNILPQNAGEIWLFSEPRAEFEQAGANVYNLFIQAKLDSATIMGKLKARTRRAGDAYRYGNMTRRVRRLMADAHLPHSLRATLPVVTDGRGILWVPGFGVRQEEGSCEKGETLFAYFLYGKKSPDAK